VLEELQLILILKPVTQVQHLKNLLRILLHLHLCHQVEGH